MVLSSSALVVAALALGLILGFLVASLRRVKEVSAISAQLQRALAEHSMVLKERTQALADLSLSRQRLEAEQKLRVAAETDRSNLAVQLRDRDGLKKEMEGTYAKLAEENLRSSIDHLIKMVEPRLDRNKESIESTLDSKKVEIEGMMKPLREMLDSYQGQLRTSDEKRNTRDGMIEQGIRELREATSKVSSALSGTKTRGNWGELALKRCVEIAGLTEHCDFEVQKSVGDEGGRPDMIIRLPNERLIIVDSKVLLEAHQQAMEEGDERRQGELLKIHARNLRRCVDELSKRRYPASVARSLDFTVCFVPGDHFLSTALAAEPDLYESSIGKNIFLASPTLLIALLRVVAAGWKADKAEENASAALKIGQELYERFRTVFEHIERVGKSLRNAVGDYNRAVNSIDRRLAPKAAELQKHVSSAEDIPQLPQIEESVIRSAKLSLLTQPLFDPPSVQTSFDDEDEVEEDTMVR
ncbi:MAG TPA: DNA recombination protein RmuC [Thermoanaerobaculia bacterium]|nr:DNA recombination protein RmuC [Thermoanaerobaculia bacterium]